jgi:hypothetical protein
LLGFLLLTQTNDCFFFPTIDVDGEERGGNRALKSRREDNGEV